MAQARRRRTDTREQRREELIEPGGRPGLKAALIGLAIALTALQPAGGSSHREAPSIANDPAADITDVYAFRNWNDPSKVVFIMNVIPAQEPGSGPNYFNFDDDVLYQIHLDTNQNGIADDIGYQFRFTTRFRQGFRDLPVAYAGSDDVPGLPPAITALDGPGSEGLGVRQTYTVTEVRGRDRRNLGTGTMFAVPSRVGPRTMPDYEGLAERGIYDLDNGGRVFSGPRDETFYIDLGATFDTLNFRAPPILDAGQDADDASNPFGDDMFSGFNVNTIAIEVPISDITGDPNATIGMYASTSRRRFQTVLSNGRGFGFGPFSRVGRLANPLVNELLIGTGRKDEWNVTDPRDERRFVDFYRNPRLPVLINLAFGTDFPTIERTDLVAALLKYPGQDPNVCTGSDRCSDLVRLVVGVDPTEPDLQSRLGVLGGDPAGFPNGRRPNDDVTDIVLRVLAGVILGPVPNLGDGVNFNSGASGPNLTANGIYTVFPFLPTPHDGRDHEHDDCDCETEPCDPDGNNPPVAADDSVTTTQNESVNVDVLANDVDPDGDTLSVTDIVFDPAAPGDAIADVEADQTVTVFPGETFTGAFTFVYTAADERGAEDQATVTVVAEPPANQPPIAHDDSVTTPRGMEVTVNVLANDSDPDGDPLELVAVSPLSSLPPGVSFSFEPDGEVTINPGTAFTGTLAFLYLASDGRGGQAQANLVVGVAP